MSYCRVSAGPKTQLAAVMESLIHAAVVELQNILEEKSSRHRGTAEVSTQDRSAQSRAQMVQFAIVMETLGNEALGKIMNIVDEAKLEAEPETGRGRRLQTSVLNILGNASIGNMSRSDYPPGYDESRGPLYSPQGGYPGPQGGYPGHQGGYPAPPSYGFPAYGGTQPGQPSAPYPSGPNAPLFPGQPGGYPPEPYPGQPQAGGPPGHGYPTHPPMPPIIPPTIPSDAMSSGEDGFAASGGGFDSLSIRHAFIRKVYLILAVQLLITASIVSVFTFVQPVKVFVQRNQVVLWVAFGVYFVTHMVLVCCKGPRRKCPWNVILLSIFTLALSYVTGASSSFYDTKAVFLAIGITAIVCIAVTVFCFQTKVDFTKCAGLFCVLGIVVFVTGIIATIVLSFKYMLWLHMLYASIGAISFTLFLAYHTQLLIGNRKHSISPEEYVFAALSIYVDIIQIFMFLLQIIGAATK